MSIRNASFFDRLNPSERYLLINKNLPYSYKQPCKQFNDSIREHSYVKMIIESYDTLNKSQAIEFLQQASSTESKLSLLDAMKDKVTLSFEEINELVPSTDSSSVSITDASSFDNLSHLSLLILQQRSPHFYNSFNNAAQSTNANKRSSLLRNLFGRHSSKKRTAIAKQPLKISQHENKKRIISGGDQVKLSSTNIVHIEHQSDINIPNRKNTNNELQLSFQGLRYDFKQIKSTTTINPSEIKQPSKDILAISIPFTGHAQDKSLSSLSDPTSMRQHIHEKKQNIQSAHSVAGTPKLKTTDSTSEKTSFNANQHKYHVQTPNYHFPKHLSAIEVLAKQYSSPVIPQKSVGLFWYNQQTMNRTIPFFKRDDTSKQNNRFDSSSDSRDTSSSSNTSMTSDSTKAKTNDTSSSSSTTSSSQKITKSNSSSTISSSQSEAQTIKTNGQYNRNQNDKKDLIQIDLNSIASRTSTSTSTSVQFRHRRLISRKQLSTLSTTEITNDNDSSSSISSTIATNNNNNPINISLTTDLFSSINNRTIGKFKVKRQRIERNMLT